MPLPYYPDCDAAHALGVTPIHSDDPGYRPELDRDADGIACETETPGGQSSPTAVGTLTYFASPSGNIACDLSPGYVRCDIRDRRWTPPPPPQRCVEVGGDWGPGVELTAGGAAEFTCATDTLLAGRPSILGYGESSQQGNLRCDSASTGMTCRDRSTGRGFTLSKGGARIE